MYNILTERMKKMLNRLKFFKHSGIERFGITFVAVIAIFIGLFVAMSHMRNKDIAKAIKYEPIYLSDFKLSKSGTEGKVLGVYTNSEKTKSLVILKLNDTGLISTNAEDYKLFLTPAKAVGNVRKKFNAGASFFTFGDTGYMGILFTSATGFNNELAQIIIRNQSKLLDVDDEKSKQSMSENESFKYFDQGVFYINMGAINTPVLKLLDSDELNLQDVYSNVVLKARDSDVRAVLDTTIQSMVDTRKVIEEYHDRLTRFSANGLTVVDTPIPTFITDDNFSKLDNSDDPNANLAKNYGVNDTESSTEASTANLEETTADTKLADEVGVTNASETVEELATKDTASTIEIASTESSDGESSSAESTTGADTESTKESMGSGSEGTKPSDDVFDENFVYMPEYTYTTDNIFDSGIMFDWWKSDVTKGYASLINLGDKDLLTYVKSIPNLKYDNTDSDQTWYMSNGVTVTDFIKQNSDLDYVNTLSSLITTYTDNINKYKALKKSYQTQLLPKLLYLTLTRDNASLNYTTNTDKNLLIEY
jgi:hypothetical protein